MAIWSGRQILPFHMVVLGALVCLYPVADSLFPYCRCTTQAEAIKRSRSHDFLQGALKKRLRKQIVYGGN
ncbi:hypothetical protein OIU76_027291 [Salix suchowensis]|nr:hypothetical protein OIU76_027291 [Salix suchowensis]